MVQQSDIPHLPSPLDSDSPAISNRVVTPKKSPSNKDADWQLVIKPQEGILRLDLKEVWEYRDLILLLIRRDLLGQYKQTVLGPIWLAVQPILSAIVFVFIFGKIAQIPTDGVPPFLFYLSGTVLWSYFSSCMLATSNTFIKNAQVFGKVYFPRLTVPLASVASHLVQLLIQLVILAAFYIYVCWKGAEITPNISLVLLPLIIAEMALLSFGFGIIVSSMTTRYRDLAFLVSFGTQLWMYVTPIVYPISSVPEKWVPILMLNPMAPVVEQFRHSLFGTGSPSARLLLQSLCTTTLIVIIGLIMFKHVEKRVADTL